MKLALTTALGIAIAAASFPGLAQTYQWKDSTGRTVISDTPPPTGIKGSRAIGNDRPAVTAEKPSDKGERPAQTMADKELEFRKRQQEAKDKADKQAKEDASLREKQELCEQARRQIALLDSNPWVVTANQNGEQLIMDKAMREQEIQRLNKQISDQCR